MCRCSRPSGERTAARRAGNKGAALPLRGDLRRAGRRTTTIGGHRDPFPRAHPRRRGGRARRRAGGERGDLPELRRHAHRLGQGRRRDSRLPWAAANGAVREYGQILIGGTSTPATAASRSSRPSASSSTVASWRPTHDPLLQAPAAQTAARCCSAVSRHVRSPGMRRPSGRLSSSTSCATTSRRRRSPRSRSGCGLRGRRLGGRQDGEMMRIPRTRRATPTPKDREMTSPSHASHRLLRGSGLVSLSGGRRSDAQTLVPADRCARCRSPSRLPPGLMAGSTSTSSPAGSTTRATSRSPTTATCTSRSPAAAATTPLPARASTAPRASRAPAAPARSRRSAAWASTASSAASRRSHPRTATTRSARTASTSTGTTCTSPTAARPARRAATRPSSSCAIRRWSPRTGSRRCTASC